MKAKPLRQVLDYCLMSDDDGHYFLCPIAKKAIAEDYFDAVRLAIMDMKPVPQTPSFLERVDNPSLLVFSNPRVQSTRAASGPDPFDMTAYLDAEQVRALGELSK